MPDRSRPPTPGPFTPDSPAGRFLALHDRSGADGNPLLMPNAHDAGSARVLASLGFEAVATTSSGFAATLGRLDYSAGRDEVIAHAGALAAAVGIPVSVDAEDGYADQPAGVAATVYALAAAGVAGCSIEDATRDRDRPIHELGLAVERVAAAAEAAHGGPTPIVLTARAENHLHGRVDLADTIARLQAFQEAGADVLFAPGIVQADDLRTLVGAVDRPVNVLALPGCPTVAELGEIGVARVSVGGAFLYAAMAGLVAAATELRDEGTYGYWDTLRPQLPAIRSALSVTPPA